MSPDLAELRALLEAATKGEFIEIGPSPGPLGANTVYVIDGPQGQADAALIVAMHAALPALIAEIEQQHDELNRLPDAMYKHFCDGWQALHLSAELSAVEVVGELTRLLRRIANSMIAAQALKPLLGGVPGSLVEPTPDK